MFMLTMLISWSRPCGTGEERDLHLWNKTENLERNPPTYAQLILTKCKSTPMEKELFFPNKWCHRNWVIYRPHTQKN